MEKVDNKVLSILSVLIIPGILLMTKFYDTHLILIPISMCLIGGFAFGTLIAKSK